MDLWASLIQATHGIVSDKQVNKRGLRVNIMSVYNILHVRMFRFSEHSVMKSITTQSREIQL